MMNTPDDGFRGMGNVLNLLLWGPILFFGGLFLLAIFLGLRPQKNNNQPSDIDVEKLARGGMKYQSGITALLIAITIASLVAVVVVKMRHSAPADKKPDAWAKQLKK